MAHTSKALRKADQAESPEPSRVQSVKVARTPTVRKAGKAADKPAPRAAAKKTAAADEEMAAEGVVINPEVEDDVEEKPRASSGRS